MVALKLSNFGAKVPILSDRLLPDAFATEAINLKLISGELRGIHDLNMLHEFDPVPVLGRAYRIPNGETDIWLGFESPFASIVKGPLTNDTYERFYWTEPGAPPMWNTKARLAAGDPAYTLGVPAPTGAPGVAPSGGTAPATTRAYLYTYVDEYGQESAPGPATTASGNIDGTWAISFPGAANPTGGHAPITHVRLYRTVTGASGIATFYRITEIAIGSVGGGFNDTVTDVQAALSSQLASVIWAVPPATLDGLVAFTNGVLVGFAGRDIYFSEPYRPWAWPAEYQLSVEYPVVGLGVFGGTLVVVTQGKPVVMHGTSPAAISMETIDVAEPGLSRGSVVSAPEGVYYASQNGLCLVNTAGHAVITRALVGREVWKDEYHPADIIATRHETQYIAINGPGTGFVIDALDARVALTDLQNLNFATGIFNDPWSGDTYLLAQNRVWRWDCHLCKRVTYRWKSKEFQLPAPVNFGAAIVDMDVYNYVPPDVVPPDPEESVSYGTIALIGGAVIGQCVINRGLGDSDIEFPGGSGWLDNIEESLSMPPEVPLVLRVWADRRLVFAQPITSVRTIRLPSGFKSDIWAFEVISRVPVFGIQVATTARELGRA